LLVGGELTLRRPTISAQKRRVREMHELVKTFWEGVRDALEKKKEHQIHARKEVLGAAGGEGQLLKTYRISRHKEGSKILRAT